MDGGEALRLSVGIVSLADYKTHVWRCGLGRPWRRPGPPMPSVSGCERQEVEGMSGAETQDV